jgi:hypothetical protein
MTYSKYLRLTDGGTLCVDNPELNNFLWYLCNIRGVDFAPSDLSKVQEDAPIIVVQHGLTGGMFVYNGVSFRFLKVPL